MYAEIIGIIHLFFAIAVSWYGIIIKKNNYDFMFLFYTIIVINSWLYYNGECLISYYIKKNKDKDYIVGSESSDLKDMYLIFGENFKDTMDTIMFSSIFINAISQFIVFTRNDYPKIISIGIPLLYIYYCMMLRLKYVNKEFTQNIYKILFFIILLFTLKKEKYINY